MTAARFNAAAASSPTALQRQRGQDLLSALALQRPNIDDIVYYIEQGACLAETNREGNSALMIIASWGNIPLLEKLIEHGADINQQNRFGDTALHRLATGGGSTCNFLIDQGADVLRANDAGVTPYDLAKKWAQNPSLPRMEKIAAAAKALRDTSIQKKLTVSRPFRALKPVKFRPDAGKR